MGAGMRSAARTPPPFLISTVGPWGNRPYSAASPPCVRARFITVRFLCGAETPSPCLLLWLLLLLLLLHC
jgi:hypothetical protein